MAALQTNHPTMSATATLSNLYVPLPLPSSKTTYDPHSRRDSSNSETRSKRTLRQLHLTRSPLSQSTGSSLIELGNTKLLVSVRGPRSVSRCSFGKEGGLVCEVRYLPHIAIRTSTLALHSLSHDFSKSSSSITAGRIPRDTLSTSQDTHLLSSGGSPCAPAAFLDETYLSNRLYEALSPTIVLDGLETNKMCIEVYVQVLQSDGGVLGAAITAASMALVDAGVPIKDLVCGSSSAVIKVHDENGERYVEVADPTEDEILQASGVVTIAMMPNWKEVTVWDQFGKMSVESSSEAIELAKDGCLTMARFVKNCLTPESMDKWTELCQFYCTEGIEDFTSDQSSLDESIASPSLSDRVNSRLFISRETAKGDLLWRCPIQKEAVADHLVKYDHLQCRLPAHSFRSMLLPIEKAPVESTNWIQCLMRGLFFQGWYEFKKQESVAPMAVFRFPEMAYCWFSGNDSLTDNDGDKWAFYHGVKNTSTKDSLAWLVFQLMDDIQGEHFVSFLFKAMDTIRTHMGPSWDDQPVLHSTCSIDNKLKLEETLQSLGYSSEDPSPELTVPTETARTVVNDLFNGNWIKSQATFEELHQKLKDLTHQSITSNVELFSFTEMIMKAYLTHMQKQFTLLRLMFDTSSSGVLTDFYNEKFTGDSSPNYNGSLIGFRDLHKILKTVWPKISMKDSTLTYHDAYDVMYPKSQWGYPCPDGISFESFLIAADRRRLFSRMRA